MEAVLLLTMRVCCNTSPGPCSLPKRTKTVSSVCELRTRQTPEDSLVWNVAVDMGDGKAEREKHGERGERKRWTELSHYLGERHAVFYKDRI